MKKLLLLAIALMLMNCSKEEDDSPKCSKIVARGFTPPDFYYIRTEAGQEFQVDNWNSYQVGETYCK